MWPIFPVKGVCPSPPGMLLVSLGSKITVEGECSNEIRRPLLLGRKDKRKVDSLSKAGITLLTKVHIVEAMVFPVVMYGCES